MESPLDPHLRKLMALLCHRAVHGAAVVVLTSLLLSGCGGGGGTTPLPGETGTSPVLATVQPTPAVVQKPTLEQQLGLQIFSDTNLSDPPGEACISCHSPSLGFSDPRTSEPTSPGAKPGAIGFRTAPSIAYAKFIPARTVDNTGTSTGGLFLDGRANSLQEQAEQPFLNQFEMGNSSESEVVAKVQAASYASQFEQVFGPGAFSDTATAYSNMAAAIAAYEQGPDFAKFNSKYDHFLAGTATLTSQEARGLQLFNTSLANGGANCISCHPSTPNGTQPPLFEDFSYDNIGVPLNANDPYLTSSFNPLGESFSDIGLQDTSSNPNDLGRFRVQTLRNIALKGHYFHNGIFSSLQDVVHFYNVKNIEPNEFPPEFQSTANILELGNLGLSSDDEAAIVAFLQTLTDEP